MNKIGLTDKIDFLCKKLSITDDPDFGCTIEFSDSFDNEKENIDNNCYKSDDYHWILKHRLKAADCDSILIKGLD